MNKQILVPLDGSQLSEMVLPHAVAYARANQLNILLLHMVAPPAATSSTAWGVPPIAENWAGWEEEIDSGKHYLSVVASRMRDYGLDIFTQVLQDEPAEGIVAYTVEHQDVAAVAMSTHGRSGVGRWVFGSVAEKVLQALSIPLLLVRPGRSYDVFENFEVPEYRSILVPLDGSTFAACALETAKPLAKGPGASLTLVSAVPDHLLALELASSPAVPPDTSDEVSSMADYLHKVKQQLELTGFAVHSRLEMSAPAPAILRVAEETHADMIVMSTHGRTGLSRLWLGSVAMKVMQASPRPVLLVHSKERVKETKEATARVGFMPAPVG